MKTINISTNTDGWFEVEMQQHGLLRPQPDCHSIVLGKAFGDTKITTTDETVDAAWQWPAR